VSGVLKWMLYIGHPLEDALSQALMKGRGMMGLSFWAGVFGLIVSLVFGYNAIRELKRDEEGHARNAAMIHIAMVSMFLPMSLIVIVTAVV